MGFLAEVRVFPGPQGHRHPVRFTALCFLLFGFTADDDDARWSIAYPNQPIPLVGKLLKASGGIIAPELYNQLGAMHGTIMVFLGIVPLAVGAFGNYIVPLQIGAPDMAFPKLNMASTVVLRRAAVIMLSSFFAPGGARPVGLDPPTRRCRTSRPPGQTIWLFGMLFLIISSVLGSMNFPGHHHPAAGSGPHLDAAALLRLGAVRHLLPLLLAFPALQAAAVLQMMDRLAGTSFFLPSGLVISGQQLQVAGGGSPLLWQHLFCSSPTPRSTFSFCRPSASSPR